MHPVTVSVSGSGERILPAQIFLVHYTSAISLKSNGKGRRLVPPGNYEIIKQVTFH